MMPLMPSPGRPKTTSTPQSIKDSTNTSDAVMARFSSVFAKWDCGRRAGDASESGNRVIGNKDPDREAWPSCCYDNRMAGFWRTAKSYFWWTHQRGNIHY